MPETPQDFIRQAIALAAENAQQGGGPFGAMVVKDGKVVATGVNQVIASLDPTAHAEVAAIRKACSALGTYQLDGCELYASCEPCPMCLGAIYWARIDRFYYAVSRVEAANAGFDDAFIYDEMGVEPGQRTIEGKMLFSPQGVLPFEEWGRNLNRMLY
jgi:guanine deaminase